MRPYALALLVLGLVGIVIGVIHAAVPGDPVAATSAQFGFATWRGMGPMYAGAILVLLGLYLLRRRPTF
ncbi:MAG TPA: hypothetical protein VFS40_05435 [Gemmatimonadales bacterium]|nr:hypothetical protein [Gemmatimonadales bacterium]